MKKIILLTCLLSLCSCAHKVLVITPKLEDTSLEKEDITEHLTEAIAEINKEKSKWSKYKRQIDGFKVNKLHNFKIKIWEGPEDNFFQNYYENEDYFLKDFAQHEDADMLIFTIIKPKKDGLDCVIRAFLSNRAISSKLKEKMPLHTDIPNNTVYWHERIMKLIHKFYGNTKELLNKSEVTNSRQ
ncbi:exported hypothetical protein [Candidatus Magnetomoraceae bacterium gMMP-15]